MTNKASLTTILTGGDKMEAALARGDKVDDEKITALLTERNERGLSALKSKYHRLILKVSRGILR